MPTPMVVCARGCPTARTGMEIRLRRQPASQRSMRRARGRGRRPVFRRPRDTRRPRRQLVCVVCCVACGRCRVASVRRGAPGEPSVKARCWVPHRSPSVKGPRSLLLPLLGPCRLAALCQGTELTMSPVALCHGHPGCRVLEASRMLWRLPLPLAIVHWLWRNALSPSFPTAIFIQIII